MNDLKLEVGVKINDNEMDQSIKKMQEKLRDISKVSNTPLSPSAQQQQGNQSKAMQEMQKRITNDLLKDYVKISDQIDLQNKKYEAGNLKLKDRIKLEENLLKLKTQQVQAGDALTKYGQMGPPEPPKPPGQETGGPSSGGPGAMQSLLKDFLKAGAASAIVQGALNVGQNYIKAEGRELLSEARSSSVASTQLREAMGGKGYESVFFGKERQSAIDMATKQKESQSTMDTVAIVGKTALAIAGAVTATVATGGTALVAGAVAAGAGLNMLSDDKVGAKLFDNDRYQKMLTEEGMGNFQAFEAAEKAKNPYKTMAMDFANQNQDNILNLQRNTGLGDQQSLNFLSGNITAGGAGSRHSLQSVFQNQNQMMGAGASSADLRSMMAGEASSANQYGISAAGSIMGRISGAGNKQGSTDDTFYRLMAKAMKEGIDTSSMPTELNRFASIATELATSTGGFSQKAVDTFSAGQTDFSQKSMQGAREFAEDYKSRSGSASGMEGQIGYGFMLGGGFEQALGEGGKDAMSKIREAGLTSVLQSMTAEELDADPAYKKYLANKAGVSEEALMGAMSKKGLAKQTKTGKAKEAAVKFGEGLGTKTGQEAMDFTMGEGNEQFGELQTAMRQERGSSYRLDSTSRATAFGLGRLATGNVGGVSAEEQNAAEAGLKAPRDSAQEAIERSKGTGDLMGVGNLNDYLSDIKKSATTFDESSAKYAAAFNVFATATKEAGTQMEAFRDYLKKTNEQQGSTPMVTPGSVQPK